MIFIYDLIYPSQGETPLDREVGENYKPQNSHESCPPCYMYPAGPTHLPRIRSHRPLPNAVSTCTHPLTTKGSHFAVTNVCFPAVPYEIMVTDGRVHDIDEDDTDRRTDPVSISSTVGSIGRRLRPHLSWFGHGYRVPGRPVAILSYSGSTHSM